MSILKGDQREAEMKVLRTQKVKKGSEAHRLRLCDVLEAAQH